MKPIKIAVHVDWFLRAGSVRWENGFDGFNAAFVGCSLLREVLRLCFLFLVEPSCGNCESHQDNVHNQQKNSFGGRENHDNRRHDSLLKGNRFEQRTNRVRVSNFQNFHQAVRGLKKFIELVRYRFNGKKKFPSPGLLGNQLCRATSLQSPTSTPQLKVKRRWQTLFWRFFRSGFSSWRLKGEVLSGVEKR